ncbi:hypothetical protein, partial [Roseobacter sp. HKCCD6795]|uniref:hypothetical protein n=1 Tax=Roseobacter sp. HKCCD6795 TaxID=2690620 RepID=UPI001C0EBCBC
PSAMSCARVVLQTCLGPSLGFQGPFNPLSVTALDYTLHLSNAMEDLQDLRRVQHRDGDARYAYLSSVKPASHFPAAAGPAATPD